MHTHWSMIIFRRWTTCTLVHDYVHVSLVINMRWYKTNLWLILSWSRTKLFISQMMWSRNFIVWTIFVFLLKWGKLQPLHQLLHKNFILLHYYHTKLQLTCNLNFLVVTKIFSCKLGCKIISGIFLLCMRFPPHKVAGIKVTGLCKLQRVEATICQIIKALTFQLVHPFSYSKVIGLITN
jgi:hypothetical protein